MHARVVVVLVVLGVLVGCGAPSVPGVAPATNPTAALTRSLRLATTTSTQDSGLLDAILPDFERRTAIRVEVIAVGTGQALALGTRGDADVVLVHARAQEDAFVAAGDGIDWRDVMYNDFVLVGPPDDPAGVQGMTHIGAAFAAIAACKAPFAARGDTSGTATKEQHIWETMGISPTASGAWYRSLGQGMGETLITANEQRAYTLSDRATYLTLRDKLPNLVILVGGATLRDNPDPALRNPYGVIRVNPAKHPSVRTNEAITFVDWLTSPATQALIGSFGQERFQQPLFVPGKAP